MCWVLHHNGKVVTMLFSGVAVAMLLVSTEYMTQQEHIAIAAPLHQIGFHLTRTESPTSI
jgi:hypothetical protein